MHGQPCCCPRARCAAGAGGRGHACCGPSWTDRLPAAGGQRKRCMAVRDMHGSVSWRVLEQMPAAAHQCNLYSADLMVCREGAASAASSSAVGSTRPSLPLKMTLSNALNCSGQGHDVREAPALFRAVCIARPVPPPAMHLSSLPVAAASAQCPSPAADCRPQESAGWYEQAQRPTPPQRLQSHAGCC